MKSISFIALVILFVSCQPSKPKVPKWNKNDTLSVVYTTLAGRTAAVARIDTIVIAAAFKDPVHILDAYWKLDTIWSFLLPNRKDTVRAINGKPIQDSITHQYKLNSIWHQLTEQERGSVRVQIIY